MDRFVFAYTTEFTLVLMNRESPLYYRLTSQQAASRHMMWKRLA